MGFSQSFLGITPQILCWASLIVTVVALVVSFYYTNITAFAKNTREGKKKPTGGVVGRPANTSDDPPASSRPPARSGS